MFDSTLHAHRFSDIGGCLSPVPEVYTYGEPPRLVRQEDWFSCDHQPRDLIHLHGDVFWHHEPADRLCPIPERAA
jgi:hypothetical protein